MVIVKVHTVMYLYIIFEFSCSNAIILRYMHLTQWLFVHAYGWLYVVLYLINPPAASHTVHGYRISVQQGAYWLQPDH